ncbi:ATP-binding protein [Candidatus Woesearchaeota archaeon]|nr:ATP-binding protein [Candidatus Woesearchaeota archaeon]
MKPLNFQFKNRKHELKALERLYSEKFPKLIVMYGRRRVGKTALIQEFLKKHKGIYLLGRQETELENLRRFSAEISNFFSDETLNTNPLRNWDSLFTYLSQKLKEKRFAVAIDEFPYVVSANEAVPSILQDYWDNKLSKLSAFIILCGSSISMMERVVGYKSPIYGRRTEQMLIEPLKFKDATAFIPGSLSMNNKIAYYAIVGGTPAYLLEFDYNRSLEQNLLENYLQKTKFLYHDALFVLREELNEPRNYFAILRAISRGKNTSNEIVNETSLDRGLVGKYLSVLIDLHFIERLLPITEKKTSRKGIYKIKDNFFKFWFRFVHANEDYIEQNRQELLLKEKILPNLNSYVGDIFEDIALAFITEKKEYNDFLFGRWWHKGTEIDVVGKSPNELIFIEVKWKKLSESEAICILEGLAKKSDNFPTKNNVRKMFGIIAKNIDKKDKLRERGYICFDVDDF